jgi:hypothetical protein
MVRMFCRAWASVASVVDSLERRPTGTDPVGLLVDPATVQGQCTAGVSCDGVTLSVHATLRGHSASGVSASAWFWSLGAAVRTTGRRVRAR